MESEICVNDKIYRYVLIRDRGKYVAKDGSALNPIHRNQPVTIHYNDDGYPCFGGGICAHLYVAHAWVPGYFDGAEVNHKDFDRTNYSADNLEWVTHQENIDYTMNYNRDCFVKGKTGANNGRARYSDEDVRKIRDMYDSGMKIMDIIKIYYPDYTYKQRKGIYNTFAHICKRETWTHI